MAVTKFRAFALFAVATLGFSQPEPRVAPPMPPVLRNYQTVTPERLLKPEDGNWLLFRRTYDGQGYSPLSQITPANVSRLQLVWSFATGQVEGHQAPPIDRKSVV